MRIKLIGGPRHGRVIESDSGDCTPLHIKVCDLRPTNNFLAAPVVDDDMVITDIVYNLNKISKQHPDGRIETKLFYILDGFDATKSKTIQKWSRVEIDFF
jgi:hypothetical protein